MDVLLLIDPFRMLTSLFQKDSIYSQLHIQLFLSSHNMLFQFLIYNLVPYTIGAIIQGVSS